jgi:hypothetical protein
MKRKFSVELRTTVTLEIDDSVIGAVDEEWRRRFYQLEEPVDVAAHVAYNMVVNDLDLSDLDGFANLKDDLASVKEDPGGWECEAVEIETGKKAARR